MDFAPFDQRRYPVVGPEAGYGEWAANYEATVAVGLDAPLWPRLRTIAWARVARAADLACGTGRTGLALAARGVGAIDGVDATPAMLARAAAKGIYRSLARADVAATGLPGSGYELATMVLADEHLATLAPVYREAARLLVPGGAFLLIGYHPFFAMKGGMPTHYHRADGAAVAIETHVHLFGDHFAAGRGAGLVLDEVAECVIDEAWLAGKPKWRPYLHWPVSFALVWRKVDPPAPAL
jgi:SAM-dependent methyltransferase